MAVNHVTQPRHPVQVFKVGIHPFIKQEVVSTTHKLIQSCQLQVLLRKPQFI